MMRTQTWLALMGAGALCAACNAGEIGDPAEIPGALARPPAAPEPLAPNRPSSPMGAPQAQPDFAPPALRKLTVAQYRNSVADLLGGGIELTAELEADTAQNGFFSIGAARATISPVAAEKFEKAAYEAAARALLPERRASFVGCTPVATIDTACTRKFVESLGMRAFRRPLSAAESARWVRVAEQAAEKLNDFHAGLEFAVAGILQSPLFLFRVELGEPDPSAPERLRYTDIELASRLSYTLWNTTPDATLLAAALGGRLATPEGLAREVSRLLADPRLRGALDNFHAERLGLSELAQLTKAGEHGELTDELRAAMRDDVLSTLAEHAGAGDDFLALFDSPIAYVNRALADIYGVAAGSGSGLARVVLPDDANRIGLLGKPAFLALNAHATETSPTLRGKYIRERILCESMGAPPPNVVPVLAEPDPNAWTMRERLQNHAKDPVCSACHAQMDPLGLALEHYDAVGRYREDDHGHALDTTGELDGVRFDGALELSAVLRDDPRTAACIARQLYRYATAHIESDGEAPLIDALVRGFDSSGHDFPALLAEVVQSEGFRFAAKEAP